MTKHVNISKLEIEHRPTIVAFHQTLGVRMFKHAKNEDLSIIKQCKKVEQQGWPTMIRTNTPLHKKETTKQPSSMFYFCSKGKHKLSNTIRRKKWNFELKTILAWMRWKKCKKVWRKIALRWLDAAAKWCARGFWVMKLLNFEEKWFHPLFYASAWRSLAQVSRSLAQVS